MKSIDYELIYDKRFKEIFDKSIARLNRDKENKKGFSPEHILDSFAYSITQEQNAMRYRVTGENSYNPDPFIEELLPEFARRLHLYNDNHIALFIEHQLPELKSKYHEKQDLLTVPTVFNYKNTELIEFLAHYSALESVKKNIRISEEKENKMETQNISPEIAESTARQVLLMHYIFEELRISGRTQKAKIRMIKMLTGKNEDKIKEILKDPLGFKEISGQIKDLEYVRKFFEDLDQEGIIGKINRDYLSLSSKTKNDKNK